MHGAALAQTSLTEKGPEHVGEGEQKEGSTAVGVDRVHSGPGEEELQFRAYVSRQPAADLGNVQSSETYVDQAKTEAGPKGRVSADAALLENCAAVEGNDVDC